VFGGVREDLLLVGRGGVGCGCGGRAEGWLGGGGGGGGEYAKPAVVGTRREGSYVPLAK